MVLLHQCFPVPMVRFLLPHGVIKPIRCRSPRFFTVRSSLPFPSQSAKYHRELEAAVEVVERACRLCVDVKRSLLSGEGGILEKNDQTPVTVADFGVQALISLELGRLFPSIPLVAEEDSAFLRSNNLADLVVGVVAGRAKYGNKELTHDEVLGAIDRGGKDAFTFGSNPATYWVLDPIDGTRGFLKGCEALYVVGLALVVEGKIVLGVMGCPNWQGDLSSTKALEDNSKPSGPGIVMVSHIGCGTWIKKLSNILDITKNMPDYWDRSFVDQCCLVHEARFCIPESQTWESLPLSDVRASADDISTPKMEFLLLPTCCGSLCKYLMVATGRASIFFQARSQKTIKVWDHAVGMLCVQEAGGKVTDWNGSELDISADQIERRVIFPSGGILVSNGSLHDHVLEMITSRLSVS